MAHLDDTQVLRRVAPVYGEPVQGRTLAARHHPWVHDNPYTIDVSCAYGKERVAIG